jgi:prepilin-type N-terminal cleavage/methylation domain-containing protein
MRNEQLSRSGSRDGFTLIELLVAVILLVICAVGMGASTARFSRTIGDSTLRSRAQSLADVQLAIARTWPTYGTLETLQETSYNQPVEGLLRTTTVVHDTTGLLNVKRLTVRVRSATIGALTPDVVRSITIAAP